MFEKPPEQIEGPEAEFESEKARFEENARGLERNLEEMDQIPEDAGEEVEEKRSRVEDFMEEHGAWAPLLGVSVAEGAKALQGRTSIEEVIVALGLGAGLSYALAFKKLNFFHKNKNAEPKNIS